jgi:hypothetical protein
MRAFRASSFSLLLHLSDRLTRARFVGQEAGNSIVDILYGAYNPSGRLPYSIPRDVENLPAKLEFINTDLDPQPQVDYDEGKPRSS